MNIRKAAEIFPPGDFIKEELEARNWSQVELAEIINREPAVISELITAKRAISPELAKELAAAFDTSPELWLNLETSYQLWKAADTDKAISERARIYQYAPVKEMIKRNWIEPSEDVAILAKRVANFFGRDNLDTPIGGLSFAMRKKTDEITPSHWAWLFRARQLAKSIHANDFSDRAFTEALAELKTLLLNVQDVRRVPKILADHGIRFLVIEHLARTRVDGITFWLNPKSPVIALSMRYDRIDGFWFTLAHELAHIANRDGLDKPIVFDNELVNDEQAEFVTERSEIEKKADSFAEEFLISQKELENFILRTKPLYGRTKIINFAKRLQIHPALVVGQLHHRNEIPPRNFRTMLEKVKHILTPSALTDGWKHTPILKEA